MKTAVILCLLIAAVLSGSAIVSRRIKLKPGRHNNIGFACGAIDPHSGKPGYYDDRYSYAFKGHPSWLRANHSYLSGVVPSNAVGDYRVSVNYRSDDGRHTGSNIYIFMVEPLANDTSKDSQLKASDPLRYLKLTKSLENSLATFFKAVFSDEGLRPAHSGSYIVLCPVLPATEPLSKPVVTDISNTTNTTETVNTTTTDNTTSTDNTTTDNTTTTDNSTTTTTDDSTTTTTNDTSATTQNNTTTTADDTTTTTDTTTNTTANDTTTTTTDDTSVVVDDTKAKRKRYDWADRETTTGISLSNADEYLSDYGTQWEKDLESWIDYPGKDKKDQTKKTLTKTVTKPVSKTDTKKPATAKTLSETVNKPKQDEKKSAPTPNPSKISDDNSCGTVAANWKGQATVVAMGLDWLELDNGYRLKLGKCTKYTYASGQSAFKLKDRVTFDGYRGSGKDWEKKGWARKVQIKK